MRSNTIEKLNPGLAIIIVVANFPCLYLTYSVIQSDGGGMGFGYMLLYFFSAPINLFLISAIWALIKQQSKILLVINSIAVLWILFLAYIFLVAP